MAIAHRDGFSTAVRIFLDVAGTVLRVAQVGENSLILRDVVLAPPTTEAHIVITVDGARRVYPVNLIEGITGEMVLFEDRDSCVIPLQTPHFVS